MNSSLRLAVPLTALFPIASIGSDGSGNPGDVGTTDPGSLDHSIWQNDLLLRLYSRRPTSREHLHLGGWKSGSHRLRPGSSTLP